MKRELEKRLQRHIDFLASELKYYPKFRQMTKSIYEDDDDKRRSLERWVENIVNSSIDICKTILNMEEILLPDNYKEMVSSVSRVKKVKIPPETLEALSRWVRLRNIVTHEYLDIRWASIERFLSEGIPLYWDFLSCVGDYLAMELKKDKKTDEKP